MINIISSSRYKINKEALLKRIESFLKSNGVVDTSVLNIVFVGRIKMRQVASTYKHEDVALPVLAFPYKDQVGDDNLLGEVVICYPQAVLLAVERERKVDETLVNLIEHGIQNILKN